MKNNTQLPCEFLPLKKFPKDLFSWSQRWHGAIAIHVVAFCYTTGILVLIMHSYFKGALLVLLEKCNISKGVAVSSLLSAGMSMPAMVSCIIGTFIAKEEVEGFAVVGCSIFNIYFVLGICGLISSPCVKLHWYSIWRDNIWFIILSITLVWVTADSVIYYTEAALMMSSYCIFALILRFNQRVERGTRKLVFKYRVGNALEDWPELDAHQESRPILRRFSPNKFRVTTIPEEQPDSDDADYSKSDSETAITRARFMIVDKGYSSEGGSSSIADYYTSDPSRPYSSDGYDYLDQRGGYSTDISRTRLVKTKKEKGSFFLSSDIKEYEEGPKSPFEAPRGLLQRLCWLASIPPVCILHLTIPDCRQQRWRKWWALTLMTCLGWIVVLTYVMTWITVLVADTFRLPVELIAITILGMGLGLPNLVASVAYSKQAKGAKSNHPVCHSLGSNIFMMSICLGFPWLIKSTINGKVHIENQGLFYILLVYFVVIMFPFMPHINKWKLNRLVGIIFLFLYVGYVAIAVMIQLNLFGILVPPFCKVA